MSNKIIQYQPNELEIWKHSLQKIGLFCQSPKEVDFVNAQLGAKLKDLDFSNQKHKIGVATVLTEWGFMVGTRDANTPEENQINAKFIIREYDEITLEEIRQAMNWSITGKLSIDPACYGKFAPMYIAKVLNAYLNERDVVMQTLRRRWRQKLWQEEWEERTKEPPYEEKVSEHRKFLQRHLTEMKTKRKSDSLGSLCWKFLSRALQVDEVQFDQQAKDYADGQWMMFKLNEDYYRHMKNLTHAQVNDKMDAYKLGYMRDYIILKWVDTVDNIAQFISEQDDNLVVEVATQ